MGATCVTPRLSERALKKCIQSSSMWLLGVSNVAQIAGEGGRGSLAVGRDKLYGKRIPSLN